MDSVYFPRHVYQFDAMITHSQKPLQEQTMILRIVILISFLFLNTIPQAWASVTVNVSSQDADLRKVLSAIAMQHGVSLTGLGSVKGMVTIHLDNVPIDEALLALLEPQGFTYENRNGIYFIRRSVPETMPTSP